MSKFKSAILICVIVIALPIAFYVYRFSATEISSSPSDWGSFGDYIGGLINPIISLATLIVTIFIALFLSKLDDRRSSLAIETTYKPELIIEEKDFLVYSRKLDSLLIPCEFSYERKDFNYVSNLNSSSNFSLNVYNIGLGPTKKVSIKYIFDLQEVVKIINDYTLVDSQKEFITMEFLPTKTMNLIINYPSGKSYQNVDFQNTTRLNHLLNVAIDATPYQLGIPNYILDCYCALLFNSWQVISNKKFPEFPSVSVEMSYSDIGNKPFVKTVKVTVDYQGGSQNESRFKIIASEE